MTTEKFDAVKAKELAVIDVCHALFITASSDNAEKLLAFAEKIARLTAPVVHRELLARGLALYDFAKGMPHRETIKEMIDAIAAQAAQIEALTQDVAAVRKDIQAAFDGTDGAVAGDEFTFGRRVAYANTLQKLDQHLPAPAGEPPQETCETCQGNGSRRTAMTDAKLAQELRDGWAAFCDADRWMIAPDFIDRMEAAGFAELRAVEREDLEEPFAEERGIIPGGSVWVLTKVGRTLLAGEA